MLDNGVAEEAKAARLLPAERVIILMSDTGGGHRSAAEALAEGFRHLTSESQVSVELVDVFLGNNGRFPLSLFPRLYGEITRRSSVLWGLIWYLTDGWVRSRALLWVASRINMSKSMAILRRYDPTIIVSVHPVATHLINAALSHAGLKIPLYLVVTDLVNIHPAWVCSGIRHLFVPTEGAARRVGAYGVAEEVITIAGIPVHPKFAKKDKTKRQTRLEMGLDPEKFTVLLVGGSEGTGRLYEYVNVLNNRDLDLQMVIIAGRNHALRQRLQEVGFQVSCTIQGFVRNMDQFMHASDLIITRSGPGIVSEAAAAGLPMILTGSLPGQEERIVELVESSGAGFRAISPEDIRSSVTRLLSNRSVLKEMGVHASQILPSDAIWKIPSEILHRQSCT